MQAASDLSLNNGPSSALRQKLLMDHLLPLAPLQRTKIESFSTNFMYFFSTALIRILA